VTDLVQIEQTFADRLVADYARYKLSAAKPLGPSASNRCSVLGHPCTAFCFYDRTVPLRLRREIPASLAMIFAEGRDQERNFQRDLMEMGYDVSMQQGTIEWRKFEIVGHRDFRISRGDHSVRAEFKSVSPFIFEKLKTAQDIRNYSWWAVRKWYGQTVLYMLLDDVQEYWLVLKAKSGGAICIVPFAWNDEMWEDAGRLVDKAQKINGMIAAWRKDEAFDPPPADKLSDAKICTECEFFTVCAPAVHFGPGAAFLDGERSTELEQKADRLAAIAAIGDEAQELEADIKSVLKGIAGPETEVIQFGDYTATIKRSAKQTRVSWMKAAK
jgi:hypothetical protein